MDYQQPDIADTQRSEQPRSFAELDETRLTFSRTNEFVFKKSLHFNEIEKIQYMPTWKIGTANRSLYVIGVHNDRQKIIDFPNLGYSVKILAQMAHDLKKAIPTLRTDSYTDALIAKYYR
jgi:hypothetical protein